MTENEKLKKRTKNMKKEQEHATVRISEVQDENGNAILAREKAYEELWLAQEAKQWAEDLVKAKEDEIALTKEHWYNMQENNTLFEFDHDKIEQLNALTEEVS